MFDSLKKTTLIAQVPLGPQLHKQVRRVELGTHSTIPCRKTTGQLAKFATALRPLSMLMLLFLSFVFLDHTHLISITSGLSFCLICFSFSCLSLPPSASSHFARLLVFPLFHLIACRVSALLALQPQLLFFVLLLLIAMLFLHHKHLPFLEVGALVAFWKS